jgi:cytochrome c-type biogenesis protein CcmH/NrfG
MRAVPRVALVAPLFLLGVAAATLHAQGSWVGLRPPCELTPGHAKVSSAIQALKTAVEKPDQRGPQLAQAKRLLTEAIVEEKQASNPAAWYFLGRYALEVADAPGADSALARALALAPKCADDIAEHRHELWDKLVTDGLAAWQDGKPDSALTLLRVAARLEPTNPKALATVAGLYASRGNDDSAFAYYRLAAKAAGTDTAFAKDQREALANAWHLVVRKVQGNPAAQRAQRVRAGLDAMQRALTTDSTVLARLVASSHSRKARGAHLTAPDQQAFTRDSTARAQAVARGHAALAAALQQLAADSSALVAAFAPAIDALRDYVAAYPAEPEAATALATLYAQSARPNEAAAAFDALATHARGLDPDVLFQAGTRMVEQGLYRAGARALVLGLAQNPYRRDALFSLAVASYQLRDSAGLLPIAQRLSALDPLSRASLRLAAAGWDFRGRRDSARIYVARADSGLAVEISVPGFVPDTAGASLALLATNLKAAPSTPLNLTVEFLSSSGQVLATATQEIPALAPRQAREFALTVTGKGIAGWRYRPS